MKAVSEWKGTTLYEGRSESGHKILFDTDAAHTHGPTPMEAVLVALCACTSVDVVGIMAKKRQPLGSLVVTAEAQQPQDAPRVFTKIHVTYTVGAPSGASALSHKSVEDAVALSKQKYCSVSIMLQETVEITSSFEYTDQPEDELASESAADASEAAG